MRGLTNTLSGMLKKLRTDLGNPSSASGVTGADAFSKIATLNADLSDKFPIKVGAYYLRNNTEQALFTVTNTWGWVSYLFIGTYANTQCAFIVTLSTTAVYQVVALSSPTSIVDLYHFRYDASTNVLYARCESDANLTAIFIGYS